MLTKIYILITILSYISLWLMVTRVTNVGKKNNIEIIFNIIDYTFLSICCIIPFVNAVLLIICFINLFLTDEDSLLETFVIEEDDEEMEDK